MGRDSSKQCSETARALEQSFGPQLVPNGLQMRSFAKGRVNNPGVD
jgi:hypothetical protein